MYGLQSGQGGLSWIDSLTSSSSGCKYPILSDTQWSQCPYWVSGVTSDVSGDHVTMSGPPEELPRSHSLLSLQPRQRRGSGIIRSRSDPSMMSSLLCHTSHVSGPQPSHHASNGQLTPDGGSKGQATASIWSRARSESFRNLRDLADRDKSGSGELRRRQHLFWGIGSNLVTLLLPNSMKLL